MAEERRRYPRIPASWPAEISVEESSIVGRTVDVSEYGLFVATAPTTALRVGQSCRVEILAIAPSPVTIMAEVRHVNAQGAGMELVLPLPEGWAELTRRA